jgi:hypothetical protein
MNADRSTCMNKRVPSIDDVAPDLAVLNADGELATLTSHRAGGPALVLFYRGWW